MDLIPLKLLVVEDSADDAELLLFELRRAGYDVQYQRVDTAEHMRVVLAQDSWDIIISDFSMPRFSGSAALRLLQETGRDIPFIIVSGAIGEESAVEAMRAGARDYVIKGNLNRLIPAVQRELHEAKERAARRYAEDQVIKLSRAMEQSGSLVMITDLDGVIEYVNPAFSRVTQYLPEEVIGRHSRVLKSGFTPRDTYKGLWKSITDGDSWRGEMLNKKKSGELYWVETIISAIKNHAGEIIQFLSVQEDISDRKKMEEELRQYTTQLEQMVENRTAELRRAKEQIELILNHTSDALALTRPNGDVETANPAFLETFNADAARAIENILWALATDEQVEVVSNALLNVIYKNKGKRVEAQIISSGHTEKDIDLVLTPVRLTQDDLLSGVLVSARDITQLKEIERFKARFVADAVHDLATPISGLKTRIYLLKRNPERLTDHIRALENQVEHLQNLLDDLRMLSLIDRGKVSLDRQLVNLNELVQRVFDTYEPIAMTKKQSLQLKLHPAIPSVAMDRSQIERVIVNLVANAVNYTPEQKAIQITTSLEENSILLLVADQGMGIQPEAMSHIFERFYRTSEAREAKIGGTGLGLAIVKETVELHGGTVEVYSTPQEGSQFEVRLPFVTH